MNYRIDFINTDGILIGAMPAKREDLNDLKLGSFDEIQINGEVYRMINITLNFNTVTKTVVVQVFVR